MAAWVPYDTFMEKSWNSAGFDLNTDAMKCGLITNTYVPNDATDTLFSTVDANEVTGTNYTAGGVALASPTVTLGSGTVTFDADTPFSWTQHASGFTNARYAVIYETVGSKVICYNNFGADKGNVDGDLELQLDAAGILTVTG